MLLTDCTCLGPACMLKYLKLPSYFLAVVYQELVNYFGLNSGMSHDLKDQIEIAMD